MQPGWTCFRSVQQGQLLEMMSWCIHVCQLAGIVLHCMPASSISHGSVCKPWKMPTLLACSAWLQTLDAFVFRSGKF